MDTQTKSQRLERLQAVISSVNHHSPGFSALTLACPYFVVDQDTTAFTDGVGLYFGNQFFEYSAQEQAGVIVHEVLHIALRHVQTSKNNKLIPLIWNIAADAIINYAVLQDNSFFKLPEGGVDINQIIDRQTLQTKPASEWTALEIYYYLLEQASSNSISLKGKGGQSLSDKDAEKIRAPKGYQGDLKPEGPEDKEGCPMPSWIEAELGEPSHIQEQTWADRLERMHSSDPSGIARNLIKEFPKVETPWPKILRKLAVQPLLPQFITDWSRPSRRMATQGRREFDPGIKKKKGIPRMVLAIDTSGSIGNKELAQFLAEVETIRNVTGAEILLIFCDAEVASHFIVKNDGETLLTKVKKNKIKPAGGGGTDFKPVFDFVKQIKYKAQVLIYLTDMYGDFPATAPKEYKTIWAATTDVKAPWGQAVRIKAI